MGHSKKILHLGAAALYVRQDTRSRPGIWVEGRLLLQATAIPGHSMTLHCLREQRQRGMSDSVPTGIVLGGSVSTETCSGSVGNGGNV